MHARRAGRLRALRPSRTIIAGAGHQPQRGVWIAGPARPLVDPGRCPTPRRGRGVEDLADTRAGPGREADQADVDAESVLSPRRPHAHGAGGLRRCVGAENTENFGGTAWLGRRSQYASAERRADRGGARQRADDDNAG